ncbi:MAG: HepT-like ribonuclease domain-containing protein [Micropruina sp.]
MQKGASERELGPASQLRNRIVHGYWSIDLEILHTTASHDLSTFVAELKVIVATIES